MPNPIPTSSRTTLAARDRTCVRCLMPATALHHRRGRAVPGIHQHCPCNLVSLCDSCHRWAHSNPNDGARSGYLVSRSVAEPSIIPVKGPDGWWAMDCSGEAVALRASQVWWDGATMPYVSDRSGIE